MFNQAYLGQVRLLLKILAETARYTCFALKGGTAINLFVRNMPRVSVDIDLTYLPLQNRNTSLTAIDRALKELGKGIERKIPGVNITFKTLKGTVFKLTAAIQDFSVKIEPNLIWRGTVNEPKTLPLCPSAVDYFNARVTMPVLSVADLYGSKLCAALDRQHPRDLFDVKVLQETTGITPQIRRAFVIYLAGHNRPISELLAPNRIDIADAFERQFNGMTTDQVTVEELVKVQDALAPSLAAQLDPDERTFLLSMKAGDPDWDCFGIEGLDRLPALQWKLKNIRKMDKEKRDAALEKLRSILSI